MLFGENFFNNQNVPSFESLLLGNEEYPKQKGFTLRIYFKVLNICHSLSSCQFEILVIQRICDHMYSILVVYIQNLSSVWQEPYSTIAYLLSVLSTENALLQLTRYSMQDTQENVQMCRFFKVPIHMHSRRSKNYPLFTVPTMKFCHQEG